MISFAVNQKAGKKIPLNFWCQWLKKIQKVLRLKNKIEVSIAVVSDQTIRRLSQVYLGRKQITDVLSFGEIDNPRQLNLGKDNYLGEIVICYPQVKRQAKKMGQSVNQELALLLIHGFLHLLGYDHQKAREAKVMRQLEDKILISKS